MMAASIALLFNIQFKSDWSAMRVTERRLLRQLDFFLQKGFLYTLSHSDMKQMKESLHDACQ